MAKDSEDDFVSAATIYFGRWETEESLQDEIQDSPEKEVMFLSFLQSLKGEVQLFAHTILTLPSDMFYLNGKLKTDQAERFMKEKYGWSRGKFEKAREKLVQEILAHQSS
jgi:hypothetical protein